MSTGIIDPVEIDQPIETTEPDRVSALELENADLKERLGRGEMDAREADLKKREALLDSKSEILSKRNKGGIPDEVASILLGDLTTPGELEAAV